MALIKADRVKETSSTTGTGALTLGGAMTGYRAFSSVCTTNDTIWYAIQAVDGSGAPTGDWETGLGTYSGANTLTRTTVYASSNSNAVVNFGAGTKQVWCGMPASRAAGNDLFVVGPIEPNKPSSATGWTTQANSTATATITDLADGRGFNIKCARSATSMDSMVQLVKAPPGGSSWTMTTLVNSSLPLGGGTNYSQYGLCVVDNANKVLRWGPCGISIYSYPGASLDYWSGYPSSPSFQGRLSLNGSPASHGPLWMKLTWASGGNYVFYMSVDGENWRQAYSGSVTTYIGATLSYAGLALNCNFGTTGDEASLTCYHFTLA